MNIPVGDRNFYRKVFAVAVPIMIQNGITNFVSMLDNIMVGRIGTLEMSGVSIINQIMLVFNIGLFGAVSGAGIMGAQFFGKGDDEGMRDTFRFKFVYCLFFFFLAASIFLLAGNDLISLYLKGEATAYDKQLTLSFADSYLLIMIVGMLPFTIAQVYTSSLRETSETFRPMVAGLIAVAINLFLNYILIFGKLGFPAMGVRGAAFATVISRFTECGYLVLWTHRNSLKNRFIVGVYRRFRVPGKLAFEILKKGTPLLMNEVLFSAGLAVLLQCYSLRGLSVVGGMNISNTLNNVFQVVYMAMGSAVAIMVGQLLGAGRMDDARITAYRLIAFSTVMSVIVGILMASLAPLFPRIYRTSSEVRLLAQSFIVTAGLLMPLHAFVNTAYFTIRSGGRTVVTFLFDSMFMWVVSIPLAYLLVTKSRLDIRLVYFLVTFADILKCAIGFVLVKKGVWIRRIVPNRETFD